MPYGRIAWHFEFKDDDHWRTYVLGGQYEDIRYQAKVVQNTKYFDKAIQNRKKKLFVWAI